jgi:hypothetical protein
LSGPSYFLQIKVSKNGHLAALCIGIPDYLSISIILNIGLIGKYAEGGILIFYTYALIISFFTSFG